MAIAELSAKRLIVGYCQLLTNPIPMENLILVGAMLSGMTGRSIGVSFSPPRKFSSSPMLLRPRASVSEMSNGTL